MERIDTNPAAEPLELGSICDDTQGDMGPRWEALGLQAEAGLSSE